MSDPLKPMDAQSLGDILNKVIKKEGIGKKALEGRRQAQKTLFDFLGPTLCEHANVTSVKTGVVTIDADSSALFQELEGFKRQELMDVFRKAGLNVREVRVRLARGKK